MVGNNYLSVTDPGARGELQMSWCPHQGCTSCIGLFSSKRQPPHFSHPALFTNINSEVRALKTFPLYGWENQELRRSHSSKWQNQIEPQPSGSWAFALQHLWGRAVSTCGHRTSEIPPSGTRASCVYHSHHRVHNQGVQTFQLRGAKVFCTAQVRTYLLILLLSLLLLIILGKTCEWGMHTCHRSLLKIIG